MSATEVDSMQISCLLARDEAIAATILVDDQLVGLMGRQPVQPYERLTLDSPHLAPDNLSAQHWTVVVPRTDKGRASLDKLRPLVVRRAREQGKEGDNVEPLWVEESEAGMNTPEAIAWVAKHHAPGPGRPLYLLLLGDLDEISLELQQVLQHDALVGRLCFDDPQEYEAYAQKLLAIEASAQLPNQPALLLYTAQEDEITRHAAQWLIQPLKTHLEQWLGSMARVACLEPGAGRDLLKKMRAEAGPPEASEASATETPGAQIVFSVCHGQGRPIFEMYKPKFWQGALRLGGGEQILGETFRQRAAQGRPSISAPLYGGIWMCVACFGAGTPRESAYHPWLAELVRYGQYSQPLSDVLANLPRSDERPFIADLPKALLAHPKGPIGFVGHVDLAWTYGYMGGERARDSRAHRFATPLWLWARGARLGVGFGALMQSYREANYLLTESYADSQASSVRALAQRARLWITRNDLRSYILLGDPAARLQLADPLKDVMLHQALEALARGDKAPRRIIGEMLAGMDLTTFFEHFHSYWAKKSRV